MAFHKDTTGAEVVKAYANETKGKTFLITGPSTGTIGGQTALDLAAGSPKTILLAGRDISKIQPVIDQIAKDHPSVETVFIKLDLTDLASVKEAAKEANSKVDQLDVLINNAGVMAVKDYTLTKDGFELQFGVNHIAHFLLTNLLAPKIIAAKGRIVNVSSLGYLSGGVFFDDPGFSGGAKYNPWHAYAQSKTANILFAKALAAKLAPKGVLAFALNPGLVMESKLMTNVSQESFGEGYAITMASLAEGEELPSAAMTPKSLAASSSTTLYAALSPDLSNQSGAFLVDAQVWDVPLKKHATAEENVEKLWDLSEELVKEKFEY